MRKIAIAMALASTALASPALARDKSWYVGVDGGVMLVEDMDFDVTAPGVAKVNNALTVDHKTGYDFDGVIGYDFGAFRLEAEAGYREAKMDQFRTTEGKSNAAGTTSALSMMLNGLIDFGADDGLQGSIGAGAGYARAELNTRDVDGKYSNVDKGFAWQALAQVRAPLSDNWDVGVKYRYFNMPDVVFKDVDGVKTETSLHTHSLMGSLIYNFWTPAPPPPPPVVPEPAPVETPPPPLPPAAVVCQPGPYIVFFDWDKSDITSEAAATLDNAISAYNAGCTGTQIMLAGHTDTSGSKSYNMGLSARRNASVQSYMTSHGIAAGSISTQAYGENRLRVQTPDGVRNDQNRRVEITYGPGSGM